MSTKYPRQLWNEEESEEDKFFEIWEYREGSVLRGVHRRTDCAGPNCVLHNPSDHRMKEWKLYWRNDRGIFERICEHGVGHPDPDQFAYWDALGLESESVHGCDGCCAMYPHDNPFIPDEEMEKIAMAIIAGAEPEKLSMDEAEEIFYGYVKDLELAQITLTIHKLLLEGKITLAKDPQGVESWAAKKAPE